MSEQTDNMVDEKLSLLYQAGDQVSPRAEIDAAILARARREVSAHPRVAHSPFSRSWYVPLSLAAVLVVAVSLTLLVSQQLPDLSDANKRLSDQDHHSSTVGSRKSLPSESKLQDAAPLFEMTPKREVIDSAKAPSDKLAKTKDRVAEPTKQELGETLRKDNRLTSPSVQLKREERDYDGRVNNQPATPPQEPQARSTESASGMFKQKAGSAGTTSTSAPLSVAPGNAAPRQSVNEKKLQQAFPAAQPVPYSGTTLPESTGAEVGQSPAADQSAPKVTAKETFVGGKMDQELFNDPKKWLEYIAELRKQGKIEEAERNLAEFKKRYPNYSIAK